MNLIGGLDELGHRRALRRWDKIGKEVNRLDLFSLSTLRDQARDLKLRLDRVVTTADRRLAAPATGSSDPNAPAGSDWVWRPEIFNARQSPPGIAGADPGARIGPGVHLYHDCPQQELTYRQRPGHGIASAAPQVLDMDVLRFDGTFASLVIDLPDACIETLSLSHVIQIDMALAVERPIDVFVRLNVKHGPNSEQMVRSLDTTPARASAEFDLAYSTINEKRIERAWLDVIFEKPALNRVVLSDLVCSRRLRAEV